MQWTKIGTLATIGTLLLAGCSQKISSSRSDQPRGTFAGVVEFNEILKGQLETNYGLNAERHCLRLVQPINSKNKVVEISASDDCPENGIARAPIAALKAMEHFDETSDKEQKTLLTMGDSQVASENTPVAVLKKVSIPAALLERIPLSKPITVIELDQLCTSKSPFNLANNCRLIVRSGILEKIGYNRHETFNRMTLTTIESAETIKKDIERTAGRIKELNIEVNRNEQRMGKIDTKGLLKDINELEDRYSKAKIANKEISEQETKLAPQLKALKKTVLETLIQSLQLEVRQRESQKTEAQSKKDTSKVKDIDFQLEKLANDIKGHEEALKKIGN